MVLRIFARIVQARPVDEIEELFATGPNVGTPRRHDDDDDDDQAAAAPFMDPSAFPDSVAAVLDAIAATKPVKSSAKRTTR